MVSALRKHIINQITLSHCTLNLRSDEILEVITVDDFSYTLKETIEYLSAESQITKGVPHLILKIPGAHSIVDAETRRYMAQEIAFANTIAVAIVIKNMAQRIIGNFYIQFDKPAKPVKLFLNKAEAEKWLKSFQK